MHLVIPLLPAARSIVGNLRVQHEMLRVVCMLYAVAIGALQRVTQGESTGLLSSPYSTSRSYWCRNMLRVKPG